MSAKEEKDALADLPGSINDLSFERSIYFWWWKYLRRSPDYAAIMRGAPDPNNLLPAFGDITGDDFQAWWNNKGKRAFCYRLEQIVRVHPAKKDKVELENMTGQLVVSFPVDAPLNRVFAEVQRLVATRPQLVSGTAADWGEPLFSPYKSDHISTLRLRLNILETAEGGLRPLEIAEKIRYGSSKMTDKDVHDTIARHLRSARNMVHHIGHGIFPVSSVNPPSGTSGPKRHVRRSKML